MRSTFTRTIVLAAAVSACLPGAAHAQTAAASWLDAATPTPWNTAGRPIPAPPRSDGPADARCRELARPAESAEDERLRELGWDLVGAYQSGWQTVVVHAAASYDGMCRPWQYQAFVFVRGTFAGTLSPVAMDSRTDGALSQVVLQGDGRITAAFLRYTPDDPACCASRTTTVDYDIAGEAPVLRAVSAATQPNR